jgi:hypothetical protein
VGPNQSIEWGQIRVSKSAIEKLKDAIFDNLKPSEILNDYYEYLKGVAAIVEAM